MNNRLRLAAMLCVILLLLAALLGPAVTGAVARRHVAALVAEINQHGLFRARYTRTHEGWFGEQGDLTLTLHSAQLKKKLPLDRSSTTFQLFVAYGPLPFAAWRHGFTLQPVITVMNLRNARLTQALAKGGSDYSVRFTVGLTGRGDLRVEAGAGQYHDAAGDSVRWTPLQLSMNDLVVRNGMGAGRIALRWDDFESHFQNPAAAGWTTVAIGKLRANGRTRFEHGMPVGRTHFELGALTVRSAPPHAGFALQNLTVDNRVESHGADYNDSEMQVRSASLRAGNATLASMQLDLAVDHLYTPAYIALLRAMHRLHQQPGLQPQVAIQQLMAAVDKPMTDLLAHQPVLRLRRLGLGMPQGTLEVTGITTVARLPPGSTLFSRALLSALRAKLEFTAPAALAQALAADRLAAGTPPERRATGAQQLLQQLQTQGVLRKRGEDYVLDLDLDSGTVQLNGRTVKRF